MSLLFSPLRIGTLELPNRIVLSPMCQYTAVDGYANNYHLIHYGQFALAKVGVIIQEATSVSPEGRITYGDLGIWSDAHIAAYQEITTFIKEQGCLAGIQLAHAGRKASCEKTWITRDQLPPTHVHGWQTVSSGTIPFRKEDHPPVSLSKEEIKKVIEDFKSAALRSIKAGYEILEIHAAHGYLIHQFLSPLINQRTDEYGGTFENRARLLTEIITAIKSVITTQNIWVRISATDWAEGGWELDSSVQLSKLLQTLGVDVIDVSTGGAVLHQEIKIGENYQVPYAAAIKKETQLVVGTVGGITTGLQAETILKEGKADLIFIGREFVRNPHFTYAAAKELNYSLAWPVQYERGKEQV